MNSFNVGDKVDIIPGYSPACLAVLGMGGGPFTVIRTPCCEDNNMTVSDYSGKTTRVCPKCIEKLELKSGRKINISGGNDMNYIKNYFNKHQESIMTIVFIILIDHFVFKGAFRGRIQKSVEGMLGNVEKQLGVSNAK